MKSIFIKIKNLIPYLVFISTYFFFVNIEAKHDQTKKNNTNKIISIDNTSTEYESDENGENTIIRIPVIPYQ